MPRIRPTRDPSLRLKSGSAQDDAFFGLPRQLEPHTDSPTADECVIPKDRVFTSGPRNLACSASAPRKILPSACKAAPFRMTPFLAYGGNLSRARTVQQRMNASFRRTAFSPAGRGIRRAAHPHRGTLPFACKAAPLSMTTPFSSRLTQATARNSLSTPHPHFHYNDSMSDSLIIAGRSFRSRLIVGTGKYKSFQETARALEASGAEMVTVAVRRINLDRSKESLLDYIDAKKYFLLPNTAGCYTADEAIRAARLGREVGLSDWVKLEVIGDQATLYPDVQATLEATRVLVKEGFTVLPYTSDDIVFAKRLIDAGAATIMPLGAPIGSGMGIQNQAHIRILREMITGVPLIVDAGVGTASDAAIAMELGADAVLMNTGIANAQDPVLMAEAMHHAVVAGRQAYLSGRMPRKLYATASSPLEGVVR